MAIPLNVSHCEVKQSKCPNLGRCWAGICYCEFDDTVMWPNTKCHEIHNTTGKPDQILFFFQKKSHIIYKPNT